MLMHMIPLRMLFGEDSPYTWGNLGNSDEPDLTMPPESRGNMYNVWADLDDSPVSYHITEPVDPTEYYGSDVGNVIGTFY